MAEPDKWELIPGLHPQEQQLPDMDTVMGMFGGPGGGAEFDPSEIPGLADYFAAKEA